MLNNLFTSCVDLQRGRTSKRKKGSLTHPHFNFAHVSKQSIPYSKSLCLKCDLLKWPVSPCGP